jgi:hypothetical protein
MAEATSGGRFADGVYNRRPWVAPTEAAYPHQEYIGPFQSNKERLISQSTAAWSMSADEIREFVRPPMPQIKLFPARYGYTDQEIGIEDIVELPNRAGTSQRVESDFSQTPNTQESTSTNSLGGTI